GIKGVMKLLHLNESPGNHMGRVKNIYVTTKPIQDSHAHGKSLIKQPQFINDNRPAQHSMNVTIYAATIAVTNDLMNVTIYATTTTATNDSTDGTATSTTIVLIKATIIITITTTVSIIATITTTMIGTTIASRPWQHDSHCDHHQSPDQRDDCYRGDNRTNYPFRNKRYNLYYISTIYSADSSLPLHNNTISPNIPISFHSNDNNIPILSGNFIFILRLSLSTL
ncbi:unnamed protein product, partial [Gordionus sp. m RMFG-2023]